MNIQSVLFFVCFAFDKKSLTDLHLRMGRVWQREKEKKKRICLHVCSSVTLRHLYKRPAVDKGRASSKTFHECLKPAGNIWLHSLSILMMRQTRESSWFVLPKKSLLNQSWTIQVRSIHLASDLDLLCFFERNKRTSHNLQCCSMNDKRCCCVVTQH